MATYCRALCVATLVLLAATSVHAHDASDEAAAVAGLIAKTKDREPTRADFVAMFADGKSLDFWLLAEHMVRLEHRALAVTFADEVDRRVVGPLPEHVADADLDVSALKAAWKSLSRGRKLLAEGAWEEALAVLPAQGDEDSASALEVSVQLARGDALHAGGRLAEAYDTWLRAGDASLSLGWWDGARIVYRRAMHAAHADGSYDVASKAAESLMHGITVRGDTRELAATSINAAIIASLRGDLPRAIRLATQAIVLNEILVDEEAEHTARTYRAHWYAESGDFEYALFDQHLLEKYQARQEKGPAWVETENVRGLIRYRLGDEDGARHALERALEVSESLNLKAAAGRALSNLGLTYLISGQWRRAIEKYNSALAVLPERGVTFERLSLTLNLAYAHIRRGQSEQRKPEDLTLGAKLAKQAQAEARTAGALGLALRAGLASAEALLAQAKPEDAQVELRRIRREGARRRDWHTRMRATMLLARAYADTEEWEDALREARAAVEQLANSLAGVPSADLARARSLVPDVHDVGVLAAARIGDLEAVNWFLEAGRAAALLRGLGGRAVAMRAVVPKRLLRAFEAATRDWLVAFAELSKARRRGDMMKRRAALDTFKRASQAQRLAAEAVDNAQRTRGNRLMPPATLSAEELRLRMRAFARRGLRQVVLTFNLQADVGFALVVEESSERLVKYEAPAMKRIMPALASLASSGGDLSPTDLATLRADLLGPLRLPKGATRVFVSPDRDLSYAPLSAAMPDDWELVWMPSATTLDLLAERRARLGQDVLGLGDPDYDAVPDKALFSRRGGPPLMKLEATRGEIEAITPNEDRDVRLLGAEATEAGLAGALAPDKKGRRRTWRSIHLACHGHVDVEEPAWCCLAVTPGNGNDGRLTAGEILRLVTPTDLVVLSACQTGRGRFMRGEGVMGLTRAFMFAGAPRVIVSLWDVEDEATALFMKTFYKVWTKDQHTSKALRLAQIAVRDHEVEETVREDGKPPRTVKRRPYKDPKYWAAWALWGLPD